MHVSSRSFIISSNLSLRSGSWRTIAAKHLTIAAPTAMRVHYCTLSLLYHSPPPSRFFLHSSCAGRTQEEEKESTITDSRRLWRWCLSLFSCVRTCMGSKHSHLSSLKMAVWDGMGLRRKRRRTIPEKWAARWAGCLSSLPPQDMGIAHFWTEKSPLRVNFDEVTRPIIFQIKIWRKTFVKRYTWKMCGREWLLLLPPP